MKKILILLSFLFLTISSYAFNVGDTVRYKTSGQYCTDYDFVLEYNGGKSVTLYGTMFSVDNPICKEFVSFFIPDTVGLDCKNNPTFITASVKGWYNTNIVIASYVDGADNMCRPSVLIKREINSHGNIPVSFIIKGQLK